MRSDKKRFSPRIIILALAAAVIFAAAGIALIPLAENLLTEEGRQSILEKTENAGFMKYVIYYFLQVIQIVVVFIPGGPTALIGSMLFGEWTALFLSAAGCVTGTVIVYFLVKKIGKPVVNLFVSEDKLKTYGFMKNTGRMEIIIFLVFLCPGLPKDALTYTAALTAIKPWRFFLLTTAGRMPALAATIWLGGGISDGNVTLVIIFAAVMLSAAAAGYFIKKKIESRSNI